MALRRTFRVTLALVPLLLPMACVQQANPPKAMNLVGPATSLAPTAIAADATAPQPRTATYHCINGGTLTMENLGTSVRLLGPDGISEDLPASPANQNSRYGEAHDAIVIDGREALVMRSGSTPMTCTR
jgi:hypothetical protein